MSDARFEDLLSRLLDDRLTEDELSELVDLTRGDPRRQEELQTQLEAAELLAQSEDDLRESSWFLAAVRSRLGGDPFVSRVRSAIGQTGYRDGIAGNGTGKHLLVRRSRWPWGVAAAALIALTAGVLSLYARGEREVVRIQAASGSLQWTGNGGRVEIDLAAGRSLGGGTLESLSAESWAVLAFRDGSTVTVSGRSMLTLSEREQKELHLREGRLSAHVTPQPDGKPMLIHTPTAKLEVLGTQLNVDAGSSSTALSVNEGRVRVTRLADGSVAEVPAGHRVVASVDRLVEMTVTRRPGPVRSWKSDLPRGVSYGNWLPGKKEGEGGVRAAPMLLKRCEQDPLLLFVAALSIPSCCEAPPVLLGPRGRFRIRGRLDSGAEVYFGVTVKHPQGGFAGKYAAARQIERVAGRDPFEFRVGIEELKPVEDKFTPSPVGLELVDCWCLTANADHGLTLLGVELVPDQP